jgi:uncharacterized protein with von Willebrand factor type A (vWA) domain
MTREMNVSDYDEGLVTDLANMWSGGQLTTPEYIRSNINYRNLHTESNGEYRIPGDNTVIKLSQAQDEWHKHDTQVQLDTQEFIKEIMDVDVPGDTPLEQAINTIKFLDKDQDMSRGRAKQLAVKIKNKLEAARSMDSVDMEMTGNNDVNDVDRAAKMDNTWSEILRVSSAMNKIKAISTHPTPTLIRAVDGDIERSRPITGFDELHKIKSSELILPRNVLNSRIIEGECHVNERYKKQCKIPFVNLIVDNSGSMKDYNKKYKAMGIVYNLVKRAYAGECWLNFSFFEEHCHKFYFLPFDYPDIIKFFNSVIKSESFSEGGTEVGDCIVEALVQADKITAEHPNQISAKDKHLVVVNDGEDDASKITLAILKGAKLHSFILNSSNADLRRISLQSGGTYREKI